MTALRPISEADPDDLATGSWILGTGGGGDPYHRLLEARQLHAAGRSYPRLGLVPSSGSSDDPGFSIRVGPPWWRSGQPTLNVRRTFQMGATAETIESALAEFREHDVGEPAPRPLQDRPPCRACESMVEDSRCGAAYA